MSFDGRRLHADAHDETAEAVLAAVGGQPPTCVVVAEKSASATPLELWAALTTTEEPDALAALPAPELGVFLARALQEEFAGAGLAVRDSVAQFGLALLGTDAHGPVDRFAEKFRITRQLPRWDPGPGPWSDRELVLLARCVRDNAAESVPHLQLLPADPLARRAVAKYVRSLLDDARTHTPDELRARLAPTFRNVRALTALLVAEGYVVEDHGRYRLA